MSTAILPNLTVAQAAEELGCSERTIRRLIQRGDLKAVRLGSTSAIRIHRRDLQKILKPVPSLASLRGVDVA